MFGACRFKHFADKLHQEVAQRGHLLRKGKQPGATPQVAIFLDARKQPGVQTDNKAVDLRGQRVGGLTRKASG
jgi:hypothetical protein